MKLKLLLRKPKDKSMRPKPILKKSRPRVEETDKDLSGGSKENLKRRKSICQRRREETGKNYKQWGYPSVQDEFQNENIIFFDVLSLY